MQTPLMNNRRLGVDSALVRGEIVSGDVSISDGRIAEVGLAPDGSGHLAVAGYTDLQVNGFAGVGFSQTDAAGYQRAGAALGATGVTTFQPTFISLPWGG